MYSWGYMYPRLGTSALDVLFKTGTGLFRLAVSVWPIRSGLLNHTVCGHGIRVSSFTLCMLYPVRIVTCQSECILLTASVARWLWPKSAKWCHKKLLVLQPLRWCCVDRVIHHGWDVREEQHHTYMWREQAIKEWLWRGSSAYINLWTIERND